MCVLCQQGNSASTLGVTEVLAIYAAILSSIVFGWNLYRDLLDKARLKVSANVRRIVISTDGRWYAVKPDLPVAGASEEVFVVINVTNVGRRPVQWQGWGGKYRHPVNGKDSFVILPRDLPKMLNEGQTHSEFTDELRPFSEKVRKIFVWDASGKNWNLPALAMKKLKDESRKFQPEP